MTDKLRDAAYTSDPDPADIIAGALQTSRAHAYELMHKALAQQDAQAAPQGWGLSRQKGMVRGGILVTSPDGAAWEVCGGVGGLSGHLYAFLDAVLNAAPTPPAQQDAQAVPTQRQYELALGQWESWKAYALELQAKLVKYEGGSPMVLNTAPTPPAQRVMLTDEEIDEVWNSIAGHSIYAEYQMEIANAMIEAYERKNGIK